MFRVHTSKSQLEFNSLLYYRPRVWPCSSFQPSHRQSEKDLSRSEVYVRSTAPEWLFLNRALLSRQAIDVGIVQKDSLEMDLDGTLRACQSLHNSVPRVIEQETNFVREHQIRLILGDIPPLCFEIAMRASVDSVAIANFTWSEIYRAYIKNCPGFKHSLRRWKGFIAMQHWL